MKRQTVTLEITFDENEVDEPDTWDWIALLDLPDPDDVKVISAYPSVWA